MKYLIKFDGSLPELLDAMSAVEFLADSGAKVYWKLADESLIPVAKGAWFTKGVILSEDKYEFDKVIDLKSDPIKTHISELAFRVNLKNLIESNIEKLCKATGQDASSFIKPAFFPTLESDKPIWGRLMGYLASLDEYVPEEMVLELPPAKVLYGERDPLLPTVKGAREMVNKFLHGRSNMKSGAPYILIGDSDKFAEHGIEIPLPKGWQAIRVDEVADPAMTVALASHSLCRGVASWVGELSHVGWAAERKFIIEITDKPQDSMWNCAMTTSAATIDVSDPRSTPEAVATSICAMYKLAYGIDVDNPVTKSLKEAA